MIKVDQNEEFEYPFIGESKEGKTLVLFHSEKRGTVLSTPTNKSAGFYSEGWQMDRFTKYKGTITLSNESWPDLKMVYFEGDE